MDSIAENPVQLCDAVDAMVWRVDGDVLRLAAHYGSLRSVHDLGGTDSLNRDGLNGRAVIERQTIHVHDLQKSKEEFPSAKTRGIPMGIRTALPPHWYAKLRLSVLFTSAEERSVLFQTANPISESFADQR